MNVKSLTHVTRLTRLRAPLPYGRGSVSTRKQAVLLLSRNGTWLASFRSAVIDGLTNSLERYMDLLSARQKVVASNVANADTPGYKTKDLNFQSDFQAALAGGMPPAVEVGGLQVKNDGNDVSLDREARLLAENAMRFSLASSLMRSQIQTIKSAISEGKTP